MAIRLHSTQRYDGSDENGWRDSVCGHCGRRISAAVLNRTMPGVDGSPVFYWLRCPVCYRGLIEDEYGTMWPPVETLPLIEGLPDDVGHAYAEARRCYSVGANAAAELTCRRILMHVAVEKGAEEGKSFSSYLDHLSAQGYVTPPMQPWVELIRTHGNAATHRLATVPRERAEGTMMFTAELLRLVYEMEWHAKRFVPEDS